jgi:hypothetical protein
MAPISITTPAFPTTITVIQNTTRAEVMRLAGEVLTICGSGQPITGADQASTLRELLVHLSKIRKQINADRLAASLPFREMTDQINASVQDVTTPIETAEAMVRAALSGYLERQREAERQAAQQAAQAAQAEPLPGRVTPPLATLEQTAPVATVHTRKTKTVQIIDVASIPRDYLVPDMAKIKAAALAGVEIPGIRLVEIETVVAS